MKISELERHLLGCLLANDNFASGYELRGLMYEITQRNVSFGSLYTALEKLVLKGMLTYTLREGSEDRGNRPQRFFSVSPEGQAVYRELADFEMNLILRSQHTTLPRKGDCAI